MSLAARIAPIALEQVPLVTAPPPLFLGGR